MAGTSRFTKGKWLEKPKNQKPRRKSVEDWEWFPDRSVLYWVMHSKPQYFSHPSQIDNVFSLELFSSTLVWAVQNKKVQLAYSVSNQSLLLVDGLETQWKINFGTIQKNILSFYSDSSEDSGSDSISDSLSFSSSELSSFFDFLILDLKTAFRHFCY